MNKILGIDLGTNSIGWALRNPDLMENQIEKFGVITFNKGVGLGKSGEFSFAAERTKKRATRRLYQARKYRLWKTLEHLITHGYCPLTIEDLNKWRHYNKEEAQINHNGGRLYPVHNIAFDAWIKLDFNQDGIPDYISPYQLRKELAEIKLNLEKEENRFKLGRALYHIAQRRGFKSSRKIVEEQKENENENENDETVGLQKSEKKKNDKIVELFTKYPNTPTIGSLFAALENDNIRIRENVTQYAIRENYKHEIKHIFEIQSLDSNHPLYTNLVEKTKNRNDGSIFYKRPLRSQKGLIGKCTLEPGKYRAPVSHPIFEKFRAWAFINNIKYKDTKSTDKQWHQLPLELKKEIYNDKFFRKSKAYFLFSEIIEFIEKKGHKWELNYKPKTTVTACPVSARLKDIFGDDYLNIKISKNKAPKTAKDYYNIDDIWHILFNSEDQEYIADFAENKLKLNSDQNKQFIIAWNALPVGYGMLSINAMQKINHFLEKGLIYTEAVLLANIPAIIGTDIWKDNEEHLLQNIGNIIDQNRHQKSILNITNNLISQYKNLPTEEKFGYKDNQYKLDPKDTEDIIHNIKEHYGEKRWSEFGSKFQDSIFNTIKDCYQAFFASDELARKDIKGERYLCVLSSGKTYYKSDSGYYKLPKLIDTLGEFLQLNFNINETLIQKIYHPSEINIYQPAKPDENGIYKLGSPKTGSFKNPMAMRALHELRKLINYLIETNQIDTDTRVVVEVARELNDANKRWAIETWQNKREAENKEFALAIDELINANKNIHASSKNANDIDKFRLWYEQNGEESVPDISTTKKEVKGIKWSDNVKPSYKQIIAQKTLVDKYRLWKEQDCTCMYTGRTISIANLFDDNQIDFEHTIPRSKSFDNSLANLTVCDAAFNRTVKKNLIPTQLNNYDSNFGEYSAILPRLEKWINKVERIKQQIEFWKNKSKRANEKESKDDAIRQKHLWQMELDYWQNKVNRFTLTEITSGFKNSQKVDTQLISKYAFHYLKTCFDKVEVQKGLITAEFRKIYKLQVPDETKDRSKHSHHAKDAAVLTLIPVAAHRDKILEKYYESLENKTQFTEREPYKGFKREHIWNIDNNILIQNITNNQALKPAKRKVRIRGKEEFIPGTSKNKWATGDSIRGQLHQETFYGAIKPAQRDENGYLIKDDDGKFKQEDTIRYVVRIPFQYKKDENTPGFKTLEEIEKQIVDEGLKYQIKKQVEKAGGLKEAFEKGIYLLDKDGNPQGNKIRHIRIWASVSEPLAIKKQTYLSKTEYKQNYYAANGENLICAYYKNDIIDPKSGKIKTNRELEIINLFDASKLKTNGLINAKGQIQLFRKGKNNEVLVDQNGNKEKPYAILTAGLKVIFYDAEIHELLKKNTESDFEYIQRLSDRMYKIIKFSGGRITFLHHLDSKDEKQNIVAYPKDKIFKIDDNGKEINYGGRGKSGFTEAINDAQKYNHGKPWHKLLYSKEWLNIAVENHHFIIKPDGQISWLIND